jgi:hypothetical protein
LLCQPILANLAKVGAAAGTNETRYDESNADDPEQHDADPAAHVGSVVDRETSQDDRADEFRQEVPRPFNTSKTFGFTTLMGLPAA